MTWNFRITVRGRFADLDDDQRRRLRAAQSEHDMFAARFTPEGTFLYTPELVFFQHRFLIDVDEADPDDAEELAKLNGEDHATADLDRRGFAGAVTEVSAVCVENIKTRSGRRS